MFSSSFGGVALQKRETATCLTLTPLWIERGKLLDNEGKIGEDSGKHSGLEGKLKVVGEDEE